MKVMITLLLPVLLAAGIASAADRRIEKNFTVAPGGTLMLATDIGSVGVTGTDGKEVTILAVLRGSAKDIDEFSVEAVQTDRGVEVKGESKRSGWLWKWDDIEVSFTVRVPREYNVKLNTSGGDLNVSSLRGTAGGETSGGNITLKDIEGAVLMGTSGGNIRVERVKGDVRMETSGGNITITDVKGGLDVNTSGGNITIGEIDGKIHAETSGGDVVVRLKEANRGVFVETSGGDIEIGLPAGVGATIDASTSGGEVTCDLPITMTGKLDESRIRGTVNGGGEMVRARTSGGDIRIGDTGRN